MIIKWMFRCCVLVSVCLLVAKIGYGQSGLGRIKTICIDPGHGGRDAGAVGLNGLKEKDLTLKVALRVGELLKQRYPYLKIVYTRKSDIAVDLTNRTKIANKAGADVFISIHANAFTKRSIKGIETYVLGSNSNQQSLTVAMKENAAIQYEEDYTTKYVGFDPNKPESYIIFNLIQNIHLDKSLELAGHIHKALVKSSRTLDRDVRQAGFWVLKDAAMPSVLIEMGYISNVEEEKYLKSKIGQDNLANAIASAFDNYKLSVEKDAETQMSVQNETIRPNNEKKETVSKIPVVKGKEKVTKPIEQGVVYAIQICSSTAKMKSFGHVNLKTKVNELYSNGRYRYYIYPTATYEDVVKKLTTVRKSVKDCFPIAIYNGKLISMSKAKEISK